MQSVQSLKQANLSRALVIWFFFPCTHLTLLRDTEQGHPTILVLITYLIHADCLHIKAQSPRFSPLHQEATIPYLGTGEVLRWRGKLWPPRTEPTPHTHTPLLHYEWAGEAEATPQSHHHAEGTRPPSRTVRCHVRALATDGSSSFFPQLNMFFMRFSVLLRHLFRHIQGHRTQDLVNISTKQTHSGCP